MGVIPYHISFVSDEDPQKLKKLHVKINNFLKKFDLEFSNYKKNSFINKLNRLKSGESIEASEQFVFMIKASQKLHQLSKGAFDPTVSPLINLWGFGEKPKQLKEISQKQIDDIKANIGFQWIKVNNKRIIKEKQISINLSAIAKGYAVDLVGEILESNDIKNYLVEIGGEVLSRGHKINKENFKIGIEIPNNNKSSNYQNYDAIIILKDKAVATSGNYRNFYEKDGKRYSHIIDPRTGYPAENVIARVTVIADTCAMADGLATTLMVMGIEEGAQLVDSIKGVEALFSIRTEDGKFKTKGTSGFNQFLEVE